MKWICCECGSDSIHGGVRQTSKRYGQAGRCYWCAKPVRVKLVSENNLGIQEDRLWISLRKPKSGKPRNVELNAMLNKQKQGNKLLKSGK